MKFFAAALTLFALLSQAAFAQAGGDPVLNPFADLPPPSTGSLSIPLSPPVEASHHVILPSFDRLLEEYISAYYGGSRLESLHASSRIRRQIFSLVDTPEGRAEYIYELRYMDAQSRQAPEAIYDLAKTLQLHWEALFGLSMNQASADRKHISVAVGFTAALAGMSVWRNPQMAPAYFRVIRILLPLGGMATGALVADTIDASGLLTKSIPVSPAHIMHLGITSQTYKGAMNSDELLQSLPNLLKWEAVFTAYEIGTGSGIAADTLASVRGLIRVLAMADHAATPLKLNPLVLVGSVVAGLVVEQGVQRGVDAYQLTQLKKKYAEASAQLESAMAQHDDFAVYAAGDALVKSAVILSTALDRPIAEAIQFYAAAVTEAMKVYGEGTPRFQDKLNHLTLEMTEKVRDATHKPERRSSQVLREAATRLRATHQEYVEESSDYLISLIARNELLAQVAQAAASTQASTEPNLIGEGDVADLGASGSM